MTAAPNRHPVAMLVMPGVLALDLKDSQVVDFPQHAGVSVPAGGIFVYQ